MRFPYYQWHIRKLRQCAEEHKNDKTSIDCIPVSWLCKDTAKLLETLEQEPTIYDLIDEIEKLKDKIRKEHCYGMDAVYGGHVIDGINAVLKILSKYETENEE